MLCRVCLAFLLTFLLGFAAAQTGSLAPGDQQLETGEYFDLEPYVAAAGETLDLSLSSADFDVYLIVLDPDGEVLAEVDDSEGFGTDVQLQLELAAAGEYTFAITSALPGETGAYALAINPATVTLPAPNPLAAPAAGFEGSFSDGALQVTLAATAEGFAGSFRLGEQSFEATGTLAAGTLSGTFVSNGQAFDFSATLAGAQLHLQTGGQTYVLERQTQVAPPAAPAPANPLAAPPAAPVAAPVTPVSQLAPEPGFITGTVFDTQGRPLAGAGVLITGTTFEQGQRTEFETVSGADGTYSVRVPDGRYQAKAWIDLEFGGTFFSRLLHPLSGKPSAEVDSTVGGNLDFQWRLSGLTAYSTPPGEDDTDFYGASIDLSYCGLPADAYCDAAYDAFPEAPIAPGGSVVEVLLTPTGPLIDGTAGQPLRYSFEVAAQDAEYPYGGAPNQPADYPGGGGGRTVLGADWPYHSTALNDIPLGSYLLSATATLPDGRQQRLKVGLEPHDVEHDSVPVSFSPWQDYQARSYIGGGLEQLTVYLRD